MQLDAVAAAGVGSGQAAFARKWRKADIEPVSQPFGFDTIVGMAAGVPMAVVCLVGGRASKRTLPEDT